LVGEEWKRVIKARIRDCQGVIVFVSENLLKKNSSYVRVECNHAQRFEKPIYPIYLDVIKKEDCSKQLHMKWWIRMLEKQGIKKCQGGSGKSVVERIDKLVEALNKPNEKDKSKEQDKERVWYSNEDVYIGRIKNGKRDGKGVYFFENGEEYEGNFKNGKFNGKGTYYWTDGEIYEGTFKDGKRTGKGIYVWADGSKYEGTFTDGIPNGEGKYDLVNGEKIEGTFEYGIFKGKVSRTGFSHITFEK